MTRSSIRHTVCVKVKPEADPDFGIEESFRISGQSLAELTCLDKSGLFESTSYLQGTHRDGKDSWGTLPRTAGVLELSQDPYTPKYRL